MSEGETLEGHPPRRLHTNTLPERLFLCFSGASVRRPHFPRLDSCLMSQCSRQEVLPDVHPESRGLPHPSPHLMPATWETPGTRPGLHPLLSAARITESSWSQIPVPASGDERQSGLCKLQTLSWGSEEGQRDFLTQPPHFTEEGAVTKRESERRKPPGNHGQR